MLRILPILLIIIAALMLVVDASAEPPASPAKGRVAPSLADADHAPTILHYVRGRRARSPRIASCADGARPSDVHAYAWHGGALGVQRTVTDERGAFVRHTWAVKRGRYHVGSVHYDGVRFTNYSARPVLVAAWCER